MLGLSSNLSDYDDHNENQDRDTLLEKPSLASRSRRHSIIYPTLCTLVVLLTALLAIQHLWHQQCSTSTANLRDSEHSRLQNCGTTPAEARALGCHFDVLSFAWQTPECYDHENTEAFRLHNNNRTWTYHGASPSAPAQYTEPEILTGDFAALVTAEYHLTHCTYMWRQLHRAYSFKGYVDEHLDNWHHTLHCQRMLLGGIEGDGNLRAVNTKGRIIYPRCRKIGVATQGVTSGGGRYGYPSML